MSVSLILLEIRNSGRMVLGDSTVASFTNHIAVEDFSWSVSAELPDKNKSNSKATILKPKVLSFKKQFDRASTVMYMMMEADKPFEATLRFIDPSATGRSSSQGGTKIDPVLEIILKDCHIESMSLNASDSGKAVEAAENVTISFEKSISFNYRSFDAAKRSRMPGVSETIEPTGSDPDNP